MNDGVWKLIEAGPIAAVSRVGHAPFDLDDPIEIVFEDGKVIHVDIGLQHATDVDVRDGALLEHAFGHLREEEPETWAGITRDWTSEEIDLPWLSGVALTNPRRLVMTQPYRTEVGYAFDAEGRTLALFGEADLIFIAALDDPEIAPFGLEIGASLQS